MIRLFLRGSLDKEILEKNARNKIRVHQCLPIVEKIGYVGNMY